MRSIDALRRSGYTAIDVLKGVSLTVPDRGIIGVLGPNGAGKTALLRAISASEPGAWRTHHVRRQRTSATRHPMRSCGRA